MATVSLKRKNIDLPTDAFRKLSIMAAANGESVKAFIEGILISKAESMQIEVSANPSPSGDKWFEDNQNLNETISRAEAYKTKKSKAAVTLKSEKEIKEYFKKFKK
ncbi:MAG: hypothetical protein LKM37_08180 [Bacteroidales bacterium]|jgi:hypothetical protein|nr:hypothetical protein [Bacteroidales bacterium]MCI1733679.1 hypothetical protein [Bacteroidales bacterium]